MAAIVNNNKYENTNKKTILTQYTYVLIKMILIVHVHFF